jgi:hypothetical protein
LDTQEIALLLWNGSFIAMLDDVSLLGEGKYHKHTEAPLDAGKDDSLEVNEEKTV